MKPESPHDIWVGLRSNSTWDNVVEIASIPSTVQTGYGPVRYALDGSGSPRLLIPCTWIDGLETLTKLSGPSLSVRLSSLQGGDGRVLFVDLVLVSPVLSKVFAELCQEIMSRISLGGNPGEAVASTIQDFRALLADPGPEMVDESSVGGLIGELLFLLKITRNGAKSASAWTGPMGQRHDFRTSKGSVEVKTSLRKATTHIHIHGLEQLSEPTGASLWLAHFRIERSSSGRLSISALFDELIAQGVSSEELRTRLAAMGCNDPYSPAWNASSYELEAFDLYAVTEAFPKLDTLSFRGEILPLGVSDLEYQIDLSFARDCLIQGSDMEHVIEAMSE
ncbi:MULTISPECIES: PD-(D/E)XK motif protein [Stenotrophomonas maltophilia group]|uniref:PD-(D/E)XK motif protein n=1 Tax=Stenotrophomonas TaxID=40323 RepID=UPI0016613961|nr:PD-(D/E)XK motif protein [Stenotrophomonas maltophilia]